MTIGPNTERDTIAPKTEQFNCAYATLMLAPPGVYLIVAHGRRPGEGLDTTLGPHPGAPPSNTSLLLIRRSERALSEMKGLNKLVTLVLRARYRARTLIFHLPFLSYYLPFVTYGNCELPISR